SPATRPASRRPPPETPGLPVYAASVVTAAAPSFPSRDSLLTRDYENLPRTTRQPTASPAGPSQEMRCWTDRTRATTIELVVSNERPGSPPPTTHPQRTPMRACAPTLIALWLAL